jgi:hypothetical protein
LRETWTHQLPLAHQPDRVLARGLRRLRSRAQTTELGTDGQPHAIDTRGAINAGLFTTDVAGPVSGAGALIDKLAQSRTVEHCVAVQLSRFATRRNAAGPDDAPWVAQADAAMAAAQRDLKALVRAIALSNGFLYRRWPAADAP